MTKRRSLHIGLNFVDPKKYGGWDGMLAGCVNDANAMQEVAVVAVSSRRCCSTSRPPLRRCAPTWMKPQANLAKTTSFS